jgi:DNA-directed RNA polymerase specialized sigma24 family protein
MLLAWLDTNPDTAGAKYLHIYNTLIKIFVRRGCPISEELADETVNRVCHKTGEITGGYVGDPALYFYKVAHYVWLEYIKPRPDPKPLPPYEPEEDREKRLSCLDECLNQLGEEDRRLALDYVQYEKREKINHRREIAESLDLSIPALRVKIHRLNKDLLACVMTCLKKN